VAAIVQVPETKYIPANLNSFTLRFKRNLTPTLLKPFLSAYAQNWFETTKVFASVLLDVLRAVLLLAWRWHVAERHAKSLGVAAIASRDAKMSPANGVNGIATAGGASEVTRPNVVAARSVREAAFARALPSRDAPLANVAAELQALSDAGNYAASCRLAWTIVQCKASPGSIRHRIAQLEGYAKSESLDNEHRASLSAEIDRSRTKLNLAAQKCSG
jgi:hypothetical protein